MPSEFEMLEKFMIQYRKAFMYLDENDDATLKVTLNLNPELTDWDASEIKQGYFVNKFIHLFHGIKNINEIILDNSMWGTTQQKRESIELNYDQFIFCDSDIMLHEHLLKHQLNISYRFDGDYIVSPAIPKWWDSSWDYLVDSRFLNQTEGNPFGEEMYNSIYTQNTNSISIRHIPTIKFGCGMHTLYSKSFWKLVSIPESFGGYGPEDTYGMLCGNLANKLGFDIKQYVIDGCYITEDYFNRVPSFDKKIKTVDRKTEFYKKAESIGGAEVVKFSERLAKKLSNP
jgi:hypothetical protein